MRRTYISPEYSNNRVYGTFNMIEESNFFGSKMLEIEDALSIDNQDIIYYQNDKGEQLDFSIESSLTSYSYSSVVDKSQNHTLILDEKQTQYQKEKGTKWIMTIDLKKILENYLFALMKKHRTFEGIKNDITLYNNVSVALKSYIDFNVYNRYKMSKIDLFISYKNLRSQNVLKYKNIWNSKVALTENKFNKIQTETAVDGSIIKLMFAQDKPSDDYVFEYFFNIKFEKL